MTNQVLTGTVQSGTGGSRPLKHVPVALYEATAGEPIHLGGATTDDAGRFSIGIYRPSATTIFYAVANMNSTVPLMTIIGTEVPASIVINELTTVAAAFSMAQLANGIVPQGGARTLRTAAAMCGNLADPLTGNPSAVLLNPPNRDQTNALRSLRSLASLVAACLGTEQQDAVALLLALATTDPDGPPADTFQALLNIARNPAHNVARIYTATQSFPAVYSPGLFSQPDAWTLAVKVNNTGSMDRMFGGPANFAFDQNGNAWIPNNVFQDSPNSGDFIVVLRPNGEPAAGGGGTVTSPVTGGGLKGPGWGITIDPDNHVWVGNFGWGTRAEYPHLGSVSEFTLDGTLLSPAERGWDNEIHRVQATVSDADGNIWMASYGNDRVVVYIGGDPHTAAHLHSGPRPFGVALGRGGNVWVSNGNGLGWPDVNPGSVSRFRLDGTQLSRNLDQVPVGYALKVIAEDSHGHAWVASSGDSKVYRVGPDGTVSAGFDGGGIDAPWGLAIDGNDNVWVANFGRLGVASNYIRAGLTLLAGQSEDNHDAGLEPGDPISPPTGYTLPSAGEPVLLANGQPVYPDGTECYTPLMRSTSCQIDAAGNVWVVNNWKPRFATDYDPSSGDPGGDGVVIFVGLAKPPASS